jgi:L-rhamnose mutarotase
MLKNSFRSRLMKRVAFKMKLKVGYEEEYKKRHNEIWPELKEKLSRAGIYDYSIFLDKETLTLFAVQKLKDNNTVEELPSKEIMKKWWDYMKDIMETNPDNSPVTASMEEVFHMD